eukprot:6258022-Prymnesium_polylepis.1
MQISHFLTLSLGMLRKLGRMRNTTAIFITRGGRVGAAAYHLGRPLDRRDALLAGLAHPGQRPAQGLRTAQRAAR